jgi:hypothetical protein
MSAEVGTPPDGGGGGGAEEHLKGDGTLDMRYTSSKETVAEMGGGDISEMNEGSYTFDVFECFWKPKGFFLLRYGCNGPWWSWW